MQRDRTFDLKSLACAAILIIVGFVMGKLSDNDPAYAQSVVPAELSSLASKSPTLVTSSDDGKTLHFWSREPEGTNKPHPGRGFYYQGSRSASETR